MARFVSAEVPTPMVKIQNEIPQRMLSYNEQTPPRGFWAAHLRDIGPFIGWFHLRPDKFVPDEMELGYRLARAAWGKGLATEGSRELIRRAFYDLGAFSEQRRQMNNMKSVGIFFLATVWLLLSTGTMAARGVRPWSYQELFDKSDLAVIATPTATNDTQERNLPGFEGQPVIGMETKFAVAAVLKGDAAQTNLVFHHYRPATEHQAVPNGPTFVYFAVCDEPSAHRRTYILFLHREADGRYASVVGQTDPGLGVMELEGVFESGAAETGTKLGIGIASVLKQCQTLKPGMTRAGLSRLFCTEGGISTVTHRTYVYRDCPYVKVDVDFAPSADKQGKERPTDVVTRISKPYLEWSHSD